MKTAGAKVLKWYSDGIKGDTWHGQPIPSGPMSSYIAKKQDGWWVNHVRVPDDLQEAMEEWILPWLEKVEV